MSKILVTTDFSTNSKAGLRFAIQLASQQKFDLTFFHSYYIEKPTTWSEAVAKSFEKKEAAKILQKLQKFVDSVYQDMEMDSKQKKCVIKQSLLTDSCISEYAAENKFNYLCISTRGAGKLKKFFGTNTSYLINHSKVPVIAVPFKYRHKKIKHILYASDLANIDSELKQVVDFAKPLKAKVELLHFNYPSEEASNEKVVAKAVKNFSQNAIKLHLEKIDLAESLITNIETAVKNSNPSMMIMFTQQNRSFFDKIFLSSNASEYSFKATVPLLVYSKN